MLRMSQLVQHKSTTPLDHLFKCARWVQLNFMRCASLGQFLISIYCRILDIVPSNRHTKLFEGLTHYCETCALGCMPVLYANDSLGGG